MYLYKLKLIYDLWFIMPGVGAESLPWPLGSGTYGSLPLWPDAKGTAPILKIILADYGTLENESFKFTSYNANNWLKLTCGPYTWCKLLP